MTTDNTTNRPDFIIYCDEAISKGNSRLIRLGAAWKHSKGDGLGIRLNSLPVRDFAGNLVAFPPKEIDDDKS